MTHEAWKQNAVRGECTHLSSDFRLYLEQTTAVAHLSYHFRDDTHTETGADESCALPELRALRQERLNGRPLRLTCSSGQSRSCAP